MCLYLDLLPRSHIGVAHFKKINWLPASEKVKSCIATTVFKYWNGIVPSYINYMFNPSCNRYNTRSQMALQANFVGKQFSFEFETNLLNNFFYSFSFFLFKYNLRFCY